MNNFMTFYITLYSPRNNDGDAWIGWMNLSRREYKNSKIHTIEAKKENTF